MTELTPGTFDTITRVPKREARIIWTLAAIGQRLGRGADFARALAAKPGSPIRREGRQYFVFETELLTYMEGRSAKEDCSDFNSRTTAKNCPRDRAISE